MKGAQGTAVRPKGPRQNSRALRAAQRRADEHRAVIAAIEAGHVRFSAIRKLTGFTHKRLRYAIYRLSTTGQIESSGKGVDSEWSIVPPGVLQ